MTRVPGSVIESSRAFFAVEESPDPRRFHDALRSAYGPHDVQSILRAAGLAVDGEGPEVGRLAADALIQVPAEPGLVAAALVLQALRGGQVTPGHVARDFGPVLAARVEAARSQCWFSEPDQPRRGDVALQRLGQIVRDPQLVALLAAVRAADLALALRDGAPRAVHLAEETLGLLVPLVRRFGWRAQARLLEDSCFPLVEPKAYQEFCSMARSQERQHALFLATLTEQAGQLLRRHGVDARVTVPSGGFYSSYLRWARRGQSREIGTEPLSLQVVVNGIRECYLVLGLVHTICRPVPGQCVDYVRVPRSDGYKALHSTVAPQGASARFVQFQILTRGMLRDADYGLALAWRHIGSAEARDRAGHFQRWLSEAVSREEGQVHGYSSIVDRLWRTEGPGLRPTRLRGTLAPRGRFCSLSDRRSAIR